MKAKTLFCIAFLFVSLSINVSAFSADGPSEIKIAGIDNPNDFHFVVMGDRHGKEQKSVFDQIISKVNLLCPAFVISVGDNIQGYTQDANSIEKMWDIYDASIKKLNVPYLKVAGNHDLVNETEARIYHERFGCPYYYSVYKNALFLFLNTDDPTAQIDPKMLAELNKEKEELKQLAKTQGVTPQGIVRLKAYDEKQKNVNGGKISDAQFEFFKKVLADNNNVRWTFVIMHKPLWKQTASVANWVKLEEILKNRPYTVFAGHEHINSYTLRNNRDYIVMSTSGGGGVPKAVGGVYQHMLWVTLNGNGPSITNLMADGVFAKNEIQHLKDANSMDVKKMIEEYEGTAKK
jgi:hypothetical protein